MEDAPGDLRRRVGKQASISSSAKVTTTANQELQANCTLQQRSATKWNFFCVFCFPFNSRSWKVLLKSLLAGLFEGGASGVILLENHLWHWAQIVETGSKLLETFSLDFTDMTLRFFCIHENDARIGLRCRAQTQKHVEVSHRVQNVECGV